MANKYDFVGWATKNDLLCSDGRTIRKGAFKDCDGMVVPLVWNHQHNDPENVLGHALLKNEDEGVRAYCTCNDTEKGMTAKSLVIHGDVGSLSIWANQLKQNGGDVLHGVIREVSLVLAGANPGATIDYIVEHGEESGDSALIYPNGGIEMYHAEEEKEEVVAEENTDTLEHAQTEDTASKEDEGSDETIKDVLDTLSEKQKSAVMQLIGYAIQDNAKEDNEEDDDSMKHNVFDNDTNTQETVLSHADMEAILENAKRVGSLRAAVDDAIADGVLAHSIDTTGMETATGHQTYGFNDPSMLFPEAKSLNNPPEWLSRNMDWVSKVMGSVHHTPFTRIKSVYANITEDDARARGYIKGNQKVHEVFATLKRETTPQTIYKLQKMDRDDIIDITDFDVVAWIRSEMKVMLHEEIARAILIGDGRTPGTQHKINETNIRPIATDVPLFNTKVNVTFAAGDDENAKAKKIVNSIIRARKNYKGSGNPTFFTTEDVLTELLLLEDQIGHKLYKTEAELATALRVRDIVTVEVMEGQKVDGKNLIGVIVNLADYNVGRDRKGEETMFDDFDINFNQYSYLIETRMSGALIKPYSALTILEGTASANPNS